MVYVVCVGQDCPDEEQRLLSLPYMEANQNGLPAASTVILGNDHSSLSIVSRSSSLSTWSPLLVHGLESGRETIALVQQEPF